MRTSPGNSSTQRLRLERSLKKESSRTAAETWRRNTPLRYAKPAKPTTGRGSPPRIPPGRPPWRQSFRRLASSSRCSPSLCENSDRLWVDLIRAKGKGQRAKGRRRKKETKIRTKGRRGETQRR